MLAGLSRRSTQINSLLKSLKGLRVLRGAFLSFATGLAALGLPEDQGEGLRELVGFGQGRVRDVKAELDHFDSTYDLEAVAKHGQIDPKPGISQAFDDACAAIEVRVVDPAPRSSRPVAEHQGAVPGRARAGARRRVEQHPVLPRW